jgi:hypothetical protein
MIAPHQRTERQKENAKHKDPHVKRTSSSQGTKEKPSLIAVSSSQNNPRENFDSLDGANDNTQVESVEVSLTEPPSVKQRRNPLYKASIEIARLSFAPGFPVDQRSKKCKTR